MPKFRRVMINDWFDPIFIERRIQILKKYNMIESEDGSGGGRGADAGSDTLSRRE